MLFIEKKTGKIYELSYTQKSNISRILRCVNEMRIENDTYILTNFEFLGLL